MTAEDINTTRGQKDQEHTSQKEILLKSGDTEARVLPDGAMIKSFKVGGTDILFPDQNIQTEKGLKRRGGIPLLWPQAGPLTQESDVFKLAQHGFARDLEWEVKNVDEDNKAVTLKLNSSEKTKQIFPYNFELEYTITVFEGTLRAELKVNNQSEESLPMAPGFHPYFLVPAEEKSSITTNIEGFNPGEYDWKTPLDYEMPHPTTIEYSIGVIEIQASPELKTLMVWSEPDRDHVCFEPWTGGVNALLDSDKRLEVVPDESPTLFIEIKYKQLEAN